MARAASPERLHRTSTTFPVGRRGLWIDHRVPLKSWPRRAAEEYGVLRANRAHAALARTARAEPDTARVPHEAAAAHTYLMLLAGSPMAMWSLSISMR
eukprot:scaffold43713_cov75-Phaeocystis_antarctica.AAC.3